MKLSHTDISMSRMWAEENKGDDDALDVMEHKLLSFVLKQHEDSRDYHERQIAKVRAEMEAVEKRFKVEEEF